MSDLISTKMLVMRPEQPHATLTVDLAKRPGYLELKRILSPLLNGGHLERVSVLADPSFTASTNFVALDMFVDEEGLLKNLPRNEAATTIYRRANLMGRSGAPMAQHPEQLHFIVGTAVLFDRRVWF